MTAAEPVTNGQSEQRVLARTRLVDEIVPSRPKASEWRAFERFCVANGLLCFPSRTDAASGERLLVRYLHVHHRERGWAAAYVRQVSGHIARTWVAAGHPDPRGRTWTSLMRGIERTSAAPNRPIDAFTEREVLAIAEAVSMLPRRGKDASLFAATTLTVAHCLDVQRPFTETARLLAAVASLESHDTEVALVDRGVRHIITPKAEVAFKLAGDLLASSDRGQDLEPGEVSPGAAPRTADGSLLVRRAALYSRWPRALARLTDTEAIEASGRIHTRSFDDWWQQATHSNRALLVRHVENTNLARDTQDTAYFYTALSFAGRYAEMARLQIGWLTKTVEGYVGTIPAHLHKGGLLAVRHGARPRPLELFVPHAPRHPSHCPACRLGDHLDLRTAASAGPQDKVFLSPRGADLSHRAAANVMERILGRIRSCEDPRRIGTRSMRVTTATLARLKGLSMVEIAALGNWRQLATAERYVRHHDATAEQHLVLGTSDPARDARPEGSACPTAVGRVGTACTL